MKLYSKKLAIMKVQENQYLRRMFRCVVFSVLVLCFYSCQTEVKQERKAVKEFNVERKKASKPLYELQQDFLDLRFGMFIHFNTATYIGDGWGNPIIHGPEIFNPEKLDCSQWARAAKSAGMKYGCLTTKHHNGFCLWPSKTTGYSVKNSPVKIDVVKSYTEAFRKEGLKVALYYSILDFHAGIQSNNVKPKHIKFIKDQLTELLTNYGKIEMLVVDGWNASWSRISYNEVNFKEIYDHVKSLQPDCLISEHNAQYFPQSGLFYTDVKHFEQQSGQKMDLSNTAPSQSGPCLQSKWFWLEGFPKEKMKSPTRIVDEWLIPFNKSYANLILNVAINPYGLIDDNAVEVLKEIGEKVKSLPQLTKLPKYQVQVISENLALDKEIYSDVFSRTLGPDKANDGSFQSYWQPHTDEKKVALEVRFQEFTKVNKVVFTEMIGTKRYGDKSKVESFEIECYQNDEWVVVSSGNSTHKVQKAVFKEMNTKRVRLKLNCFEPYVQIAEFGIYNE